MAAFLLYNMANVVIQRNGGFALGCYLGNMQIKCPDTPNHKYLYSIEFLMARNHEIDAKFASLAHVVQKL